MLIISRFHEFFAHKITFGNLPSKLRQKMVIGGKVESQNRNLHFNTIFVPWTHRELRIPRKYTIPAHILNDLLKLSSTLTGALLHT
jgi:hypothetical protein